MAVLTPLFEPPLPVATLPHLRWELKMKELMIEWGVTKQKVVQVLGRHLKSRLDLWRS